MGRMASLAAMERWSKATPDQKLAYDIDRIDREIAKIRQSVSPEVFAQMTADAEKKITKLERQRRKLLGE